MVTFIDQHRDIYGVEPICAVLPVAPSTYFVHKAQQAAPTRRSERRQRDDDVRAAIQCVWDDNDQVSGPRKLWKQLRRQGYRVARCTIERLMRGMGLRGVSRGRAWVTTTRAHVMRPTSPANGEVYVQSLPTLGDKRVVSVDGGAQPAWWRDGTELFYLALDQTLMAVPLTEPGGTLRIGQAAPLFRAPLSSDIMSYRDHYVRAQTASGSSSIRPTIAAAIAWT